MERETNPAPGTGIKTGGGGISEVNAGLIKGHGKTQTF